MAREYRIEIGPWSGTEQGVVSAASATAIDKRDVEPLVAAVQDMLGNFYLDAYPAVREALAPFEEAGQ